MMTVSGGATSLIGDLGEAAGLNFPPIAESTNVRIQEILGVERAFGNPLDTVGLPRLRRDGNISAVVQALQDDDGVDVIGLVLGMRGDGWGSHQELVDRLAAAAKGARKPLMVVSFMSNSLTRHWRGYAQANGLPLVEDLERGLRRGRDPDARIVCRCPERRILAPAQVVASPRARVLTEAQSKAILGAAGLPVTREALARDPAEAVRLAAEIRGAVALKIQSAEIAHKSDIGGVHLGARTAAEVEAAARKVFDNARRNCPGATIDGILVQEMVEDGVEFILGMTYDETFGPLVVCGAGGVTVEVFKDAAVLLPPFGAEEAAAAIKSLKVAKLLDGFRGSAPRDVDALVDCCVRFGDFVAATDGQYAAIDLNPVLVARMVRRPHRGRADGNERRRRMSNEIRHVAMLVALRSGLVPVRLPRRRLSTSSIIAGRIASRS
jgi:acetyltransferase